MVNVRTKNKQGQSDRGTLSGSCRHGGNSLDSGYILKVESVRFVDGLDVRCERKEGVRNDAKVFGLSSCKEIVIILSCLTLLLFFSCPNFSVSIYSRLSTLFLQPQPEEQGSVLYFSTFLQIGCACCHCCWPYSPILPSPEAFRLLCTVSCATEVAWGGRGTCRGCCSACAAEKYVCAFLHELLTQW